MSISPEELHSYLSVMNNEWARTQLGPKAKVESFLVPGAGFFPDRLVVPRSIVSADTIDIIRKKLYEGVSHGYSMGIRTVANRPIFGGGKLDWDLQIDTRNKVSNFLKNTLPKWQVNASLNNYKITQLILMDNLPEMGTKNKRSHQFVFRVAWDNYNSLYSLGSRLLMEMTTGTNKLRELDQKMENGNDNIIRYQCLYRVTGFLEKTELQIGNNITDPMDTKIVLSVVSQLNSLIKDPGIQFLKRLDFFASLGLNIVEFQGYFYERTGVTKMLIYGLRGTNDETNTGSCP